MGYQVLRFKRVQHIVVVPVPSRHVCRVVWCQAKDSISACPPIIFEIELLSLKVAIQNLIHFLKGYFHFVWVSVPKESPDLVFKKLPRKLSDLCPLVFSLINYPSTSCYWLTQDIGGAWNRVIVKVIGFANYWLKSRDASFCTLTTSAHYARGNYWGVYEQIYFLRLLSFCSRANIYFKEDLIGVFFSFKVRVEVFTVVFRKGRNLVVLLRAYFGLMK